MSTTRRTILIASGATLATPNIAPAQEAPGVTATEIRIGSTNSLSGPASAYSVISTCLTAMFRRLNDEGGVAGRRINFTVYDDAYSPPRTLEQTRRLVEQVGDGALAAGPVAGRRPAVIDDQQQRAAARQLRARVQQRLGQRQDHQRGDQQAQQQQPPRRVGGAFIGGL